jgi:hypothetical protein
VSALRPLRGSTLLALQDRSVRLALGVLAGYGRRGDRCSKIATDRAWGTRREGGGYAILDDDDGTTLIGEATYVTFSRDLLMRLCKPDSFSPEIVVSAGMEAIEKNHVAGIERDILRQRLPTASLDQSSTARPGSRITFTPASTVTFSIPRTRTILSLQSRIAALFFQCASTHNTHLRDQAPAGFHRIAECGLRARCFGSGVDHPCCTRRVFRP